VNRLQPPAEYLPALMRLRERDEYAKHWPLRLERHTNRHRETDGGCWGWYEVHPLGIEVGYWGSHKDDLRDVDITAWNAQAALAAGRGE
jgi:hypothetical protein